MRDRKDFLVDGGPVFLRIATKQDREKTVLYAFEETEGNSYLSIPLGEEGTVKDLLIDLEEARDEYLLAVVLRESDTVIGFCEINEPDSERPILSVTIGSAYRGHGYGRATAEALVRAASRLCKAEAFLWETTHENTVSQHLAEAIGGERLADRPKTPADELNAMFIKNGLKSADETFVCYRIPRRE